MRRKLSRLAAVAGAVIVLAVAGPLGRAAAATPPAPGQFALTPTPADGQSRHYFKLAVDPGHSGRDVIVVSNVGSTPITLRLGTSNGVTAANSGSAFGPLATPCAGIGCWVAGLPKTVTVGPHSGEEVPFRVAVPAGTRPGQYLAGITATPATAPKPVKLKTTGHTGTGTQVVILERVSVGVAVTVGPLASLDTKIDVTGVTAGWIQTLVRLSVNVRNVGQRFTKGSGTMTCQLAGGARSYPVYMDTVLPGDTAALQVNGVGMHTGSWPCTIRVKDSGGHTDTWAGTVTVPAAVAAATKRIGQNDYVVPAEPGIPAWAIALIVLGGLILFSIWALILRRSHDKNRARPADD
jgi:hypothetical protein